MVRTGPTLSYEQTPGRGACQARTRGDLVLLTAPLQRRARARGLRGA